LHKLMHNQRPKQWLPPVPYNLYNQSCPCKHLICMYIYYLLYRPDG
jgi:hypothetical protein